MVKEKILNSFISSNMQTLGLHHVNSEVPKVVTEHAGKRTDILGFDLATFTPVILELKVKRDPHVVDQLQEYIALISKKYPNLFEELNAFRRLDGFRFNYTHGIVGIVLSPFPPPQSIDDQGTTILWARFTFDNDEVFRIVDRRALTISESLAHLFDRRPPFREGLASQLVSPSLPRLRRFAELLNEAFLSVSTTINQRATLEHNYIAYYATDTTRVVFGFNTGPDHSHIDVEFSVYAPDHGRFKSHPASQEIGALGLHMAPPRKQQIFPIRIDDRFAGDEPKVAKALAAFKELAELSYGLTKVPELQTLRIDPHSVNAMALKSFGLT